jgi:hypothetical protein
MNKPGCTRLLWTGVRAIKDENSTSVILRDGIED